MLKEPQLLQRILSRNNGSENGLFIGVLELIAVLCQLAYTFLYLKEIDACWPFAIAGSLIFSWICLKKNIPAESLLYIFYVGTALFGWISNANQWQEQTWSMNSHLLLLTVSALAWLALAFYLRARLNSAKPYADSFTTIFSLGATLLMINMIHLNWLWWIVIDLVAVYLYSSRKLYLGSLLYLLYAIMAADGFLKKGWFT